MTALPPEAELARIEWVTLAAELVRSFQARELEPVDDDPDVVHHLYAIKLDRTAGVWATSGEHALRMVQALEALLRLLLDDDELELYVSASRCGS